MNIIYSRKKRFVYFTISAILIILSICAIVFIKPKIGIDFSGGTLLELKFKNDSSKAKIEEEIKKLDFIKGEKVQSTGTNTYLLRINSLDKTQIDTLRSAINEKVGEYQEIRLETVGPIVSSDTTTKAIWATIFASIGIILYVAYAFRSVPNPASSWRFGVCAITALIHDLIISVGIYTILGYFLGFEIDTLFIVAILTILGYSVNDTIVIFDRIRENLKMHPEYTFSENVNNSTSQSLARSLNTSLTVVIILLALLFLGGESIKPFVSLLMIGVTIGTYSSIFVAPPLLIQWQNKIINKTKNN